ncbi:MAG TPA: 50S ribosomal protein L19e [Euryarchaeota archaeon]|nr:50S ribosomal protein L19e [Euryarchaeota archaeon]
MDLTFQKRLAAEILKCGINRVWIDPTGTEDVADAITRGDIRMAIRSGTIKKKPKMGISRSRKQKNLAQRAKGRRKGHGRRKGTKYARKPKKERWMQTIRPIRAKLKTYRNEGRMDTTTYRKYYLQAKGGMFKSKAHLDTQLEIRGDLKEAGK